MHLQCPQSALRVLVLLLAGTPQRVLEGSWSEKLYSPWLDCSPPLLPTIIDLEQVYPTGRAGVRGEVLRRLPRARKEDATG